jgi:transketolase
MENHELKTKADALRLEAVRMVYEGGDGHPGPALSIADIITTLFYDEMNIDPKNPTWEDRDRFILSKGHACPIYYAALVDKGYLGGPIDHYELRQLGSNFQGHPVMNKLPGVDMTSGSLGNGISIGTGMAKAAKFLKKDFRTYVIVGDGELQEGIGWEGINTAAAHKLDNMVVLVDLNGWQSGGTVLETIGATNIKERFEAFCWNTYQIDGHDYDALKTALADAKTVKGKPSAIVCETVKGKGLDYMENDNSWHKRVPTDEQYAIAVQTLGGHSS